ncbi:protein Shroom1 [Periophthalmus magnuspinnatus]|uniref:protein Shroom1 n=1 Tax=Periophthalmus magnuspinnatus TaxID=409849 RepID=UPI00145AA392|nr:protein Shroom1 [Periophthalmus magnuspinnatus]
MDSYNFHFERMSNIDLHPLSLPMSRLSPAKSNSSIVEQFAHHHQHGKGDSAYSSFSGGSTAPDYPSPFLPDDVQSSSFSQYADLKYVKSLYNPSQVLQSDPKTMDQLYRSVEAISQQYRHSNNSLNHYNGESGFNNNKPLTKQELASQGGFITQNPPPIPTRMDSFITTKNLENNRTHQELQQTQSQSPRLPLEKSNVKKDAYRRASQPPSYHPHHLPKNQTLTQTNLEYFAVNSNRKIEEPGKMGKNLSQSPPKGANQDGRNSLEHYRRRAHSTNDFTGSDSQREYRSWSVGQSVINSSIQHKGQFYFVTGVCKKTPDSDMIPHASSVCGSESGSELETYKLRERCHSTMENLFRPLQPSPCVLASNDRGFVNISKSNNVINLCGEENMHQGLSKSSRSLEALEEIDVARDIGRHTPSNPIFYCGPERTSPLQQTKEVANLSSEQLKPVREEQGKRVNRQSLGDVASERINKETTPLLYQLTGASRAGFRTEAKSNALDVINEPQVEASDNQALDPACNTLDHSYKKFYREQLKDVQSKVLRETSFKRRDLQLSWPHRVRGKPETNQHVQDVRLIVHQFTSSQDSQASTETLTPSVTSEDTEKGSVKEEADIKKQNQAEKESEKENGRPVNVAQPQVARIGGRKRLTQEQKKMCFSEPEKLHQIGGGRGGGSCRSFGNEFENVFTSVEESEEQLQQAEPGLVAARRKIFETRGRALSASSASKSSLKHLQHKALVEFMERKTGQKMAEPQQPAPQAPPPIRQRHSLGEKPFDWGFRPQSGPLESKRKRMNRPHSAGRILDSSTSSIRYAQFFPNQSSSGQFCSQPYQSKWRESRGPSQGKSVSVEDLLDQSNRSFYRNRSTSSPHAFQAFDSPAQDPLLVNDTKETSSPRKDFTADSPVKAEGQQSVRVVAQRGKSMEELGTTTFTRPKALSKSTEQLDQLWRHSTRPEPDRNEKMVSNNAQDFKEQHKISKSQEIIQNQDTQGQPKQKKSPVKQNSEPILGGNDDVLGNQDSSSSPGSCSSSRTRIQSHGGIPAEPWTNPPECPSGQDPSEREKKSTSSSPTQTKPGYENRLSPRSVLEVEESVDEPSITDLPPPPPLDPNQEVSLSCGVTTDPSLWLLPPPPSEDQLKQDVPNPQLTDVFTNEPVNTPAETSPSPVSPSISISDLDAQQVNEEKTPRNEDKNVGQNPDLEERGTPEGETEAQQAPAEKPQWEELVVSVVKADHSLARVLYPLANRKTALMLMEQLLSEDTLLMEEHYKKKQEQKGESVEVAEIAETFSCSSSQNLDTQSKADIREKKHLLVSYIEERLRSLSDSRAVLQTEMDENAQRGDALQGLVRERCLPVEVERYTLFMGDLERVVSLLLCLSARLARVQNALSTVDQHTDAEEKQSLDSRHRLLCKQRDDAKDLKDNLDRRESQVSAFLSRQLSPDQLQDYRRYVQTKASLLIRQKDLEERQRLGEEQLEALSHTLNL